MQPVAIPKLQQGTYTQMSVTIASATVNYIDPTTHANVQKTITRPFTVNVGLNPAMIVGSSAMVMNLDMDVAHSMNIDASGNVSMTPAFRAFANIASATAPDPEHGMMVHLIGSVSGTSGSTFTMTTLQGMQMSFTTGSGTQFQGMGGVGSMGNGMLLKIDSSLQPDGNMNANYVQQMMSSGGLMAMGIVGSFTGSPATQLNLTPMDGVGNGMMSSLLGNGMTANVSSSTAYTIDTVDADMHNLPFTPVFEATHIYAGQMISTLSASGMMSGGMMGGATQTAAAGQLECRGFNGTVANYNASSGAGTFTLTLATESAFTSLTRATSLTVFQQAGTQFRDLTAISNTMNLRVRRLLFYDAGVYKQVATKITAPQ